MINQINHLNLLDVSIEVDGSRNTDWTSYGRAIRRKCVDEIFIYHLSIEGVPRDAHIKSIRYVDLRVSKGVYLTPPF